MSSESDSEHTTATVEDTTLMDNNKNETITKKSSPRNSLFKDFAPGERDILVGRGKKCYDHIGNKALRKLVNAKMKEYSAATSKFDKSQIISFIIDQVRNSNGCFVKQDPNNENIWYDVGDREAKRKVAQTFRDVLCDQYRSSYVFKNEKRKWRESSCCPITTNSSTTSMNYYSSSTADEKNIDASPLSSSQTPNLPSSLLLNRLSVLGNSRQSLPLELKYGNSLKRALLSQMLDLDGKSSSLYSSPLKEKNLNLQYLLAASKFHQQNALFTRF